MDTIIPIIAFIVYFIVIILWCWKGREISEAMLVAFIVVALFGGNKCLDLIVRGINFAAQQDAVYAAMAFALMAYLMDATGCIERLINMLNSVLGKFKGGAGYVSTLGSALFGLVSGSGSGNAATVGGITIPWMKKSNWPPEAAATLVAGNAGLGISIPPSATMFILLGMAAVKPYVDPAKFYIALLVAGMYTVVQRLLLCYWMIRKYKVTPVPKELIPPKKEAFKTGWPTLFIIISIIVPVALTTGPIADYLTSIKPFGSTGVKALSSAILYWIPIVASIVTIIVGWNKLPKDAKGLYKFLANATKRYYVIGATIFFAFAASQVLTDLGLSKALMDILSGLYLPKFVWPIIVGIIIVLAAAPLTSTATVTALGAICWQLLYSAGYNPVLAAVLILLFSSTEGMSPPNSAPIFIAASIADCNPVSTFKPLVFYYIPTTMLIALLIAWGILPIPL
ncbi:MAG: TRAP transporter permease [Candidatus Verstraetearchaeota archaeon]|jgi:TRAP-type C4-dicarboxylate transport system permease large subunit|nr:TRAP transporter permease [Candidatus Verstraetearchaeota archaeon]